MKVGEAAPDFALPSHMGGTIRLSDIVGKKNIVLYFYPKDFTAGCTKEAKEFSNKYEIFKELDAEVFGISSDSIDSHRSFASYCKIPFIIMSDEGGEVRRLYGVPKTFGLIPGRITYIIDKRGIVRHVFSSQFNAKSHIDEAIEALNEINKEVKYR
jgi:peroxiredoxin Q/BCP